nr:serine/threonine-protein phosphatase 7 long form homolog [Ipomoea batatas]
MPATYDLRRRRTPDAHFPSAVFRGNIRVFQMRVSADPHFQIGPFVRGPRQAIWTARVPLLFFYAVEWHYPDRVCRQFGGYQDIPSHVEYDHNLHKLDGRTKNEDCGVFHHAYVALWENRTHQLVPIGTHSPLGPYVTLAYEHWFYRVEALRHISIQGAIAAEQGQSNNYTNVKQQIATDELNQLNYGYVLQFPRTACAYFYEPIDQVLGPDQRRQGNRRGRAAQGGHRRQHSLHINLNDEVHMEVQHDDPEMGDVTQQDFTQTLMSQSPFRTPYVAHGHVFEDGSSSQSPRHVAR